MTPTGDAGQRRPRRIGNRRTGCSFNACSGFNALSSGSSLYLNTTTPDAAAGGMTQIGFTWEAQSG